MNATPYTYVFVRTDLSPPQQIVQAAHAAHQAGELFGSHSHMVLIGVKSEEELLKINVTLDANGIRSTTFFEPDVDCGEYTATVTEPVSGERRKPLRRYQLLRESL